MKGRVKPYSDRGRADNQAEAPLMVARSNAACNEWLKWLQRLEVSEYEDCLESQMADFLESCSALI